MIGMRTFEGLGATGMRGSKRRALGAWACGVAGLAVSCGPSRDPAPATSPEPSLAPNAAPQAASARPSPRATLDLVRATPGGATLVASPLELGEDVRGFVARSGTRELRLPRHARGVMHLEAPDGASVDVEAEDVADVPATAVDRTLVYAGAVPDGDVIALAREEGLEELRVLRAPAPIVTARYRVTLSGGLASLRLRGDRVEALDRDGRARIATEPMRAIDAHGAARLASVRIEAMAMAARDGAPGDARFRVITELATAGLAAPIVVDPAWLVLASAPKPRMYGLGATITGGALLFGGLDASFAIALTDSEIYDAKTRQFRAGPNRATTTLTITAAAVPGGVLAIGGVASRSSTTAVSTVERYDVAANAWSMAPSLAKPRQAHAVVVLANGDVLVVGGGADADASTCERFDPKTSVWRAAGSLATGRTNPIATRLASGKVLVVGGGSNSAELYDPASDAWSPAGSVPTLRSAPALLPLPSGKAMLVGGADFTTDASYDDVFAFDPATKTWTVGPKLLNRRGYALVGELAGSPPKPLLIGGLGDGAWLQTTDTFDEATGAWAPAGGMSRGHWLGTAVQLEHGAVLVSGGFEGKASPASAADLYGKSAGEPCSGTSACLSGFCVDGRCCETACAGQCEACDVPGSLGTCSPISGAPHSTRAPCDEGGGEICKAKACDGLLDRTKCVGFANGTAAVCKAAACVDDAFSADATCNGAGVCRTVTPSRCTPYSCSDLGCKSSCAADADCAKTFRCEGSKCLPRDATCTADGTASTPRVGAPVPCAPYTCDPLPGTCHVGCADSTACASGYICDAARRECVHEVAAPGDDGGASGGCASAAGHAEAGAWGGVAAAAILAARARRRRAPQAP